ncbi:hypothetical protein [Candidatus Nitrosocosmicus franklandus]|uniref:Uncharacterized protein n=1 Tax=Candidatus Nitrosocosmicus franklandianus TaxID=1798806 RepID=A0A484I8A7_9ARCH|nr:hypothetical protein [Candidatus Nitrosocosmicus franklandus]VFJ13940.1 conserved exported protein of unknown function [Candidatus Nitrosocosmicus franklandus]
MNKTFLLLILAAIFAFFDIETFEIASAQPTIENSSNLTYPNNPSMTTGEMINGTNTEGYNFSQSGNNLPSPM